MYQPSSPLYRRRSNPGTRLSGCALLALLSGCSGEGSTALGGSPPGTDPSGRLVWTSIDAGAAVTCGVTADGRGFCWGEQWSAGGGGPRQNTVSTPREVPGGRKWVVIEAGRDLICGLARDATTYCWGGGFDTVATRIEGDPGFVSISVGDTHACGLTRDGTGYCWGDDFRGQVGDGRASPATPRRASPVAGGLRFEALRAGPESTCGLVAGGDLYCWGGSEVGGEAVAPRLVQRGLALADLALGGSEGGRGLTCARSAVRGAVYCVRYEPHEGLPQPTPREVRVPGGELAGPVAVGGGWTPDIGLPYEYLAHACAPDGTGAVWCWGASEYGWGSNRYGQLGDGTATDRDVPARVVSLSGVVRVTAGGAHTCAITRSGEAYCWGANNRGQLGNGRSGGSGLFPERVVDPRP